MSRTHLVPTHLKAPETLISFAGFNLTVRQFLILLVGLALGYQVFSLFDGWECLWVQVIRWALAALPVLAALHLAFVHLARRSLDRWLLVVARYLLRPHRLVWRSIRFSEPLAMTGLVEEEERR